MNSIHFIEAGISAMVVMWMGLVALAKIGGAATTMLKLRGRTGSWARRQMYRAKAMLIDGAAVVIGIGVLWSIAPRGMVGVPMALTGAAIGLLGVTGMGAAIGMVCVFFVTIYYVTGGAK